MAHEKAELNVKTISIEETVIALAGAKVVLQIIEKALVDGTYALVAQSEALHQLTEEVEKLQKSKGPGTVIQGPWLDPKVPE